MLNSWRKNHKKSSHRPRDHEKTWTILSQILYTQTCKSWEVNVRFLCQYQFIVRTEPILISFYRSYWGKDYRDLFVEKGDHKLKQRQVILCIQNPPFNEKTWKNTPLSKIPTHKREHDRRKGVRLSAKQRNLKNNYKRLDQLISLQDMIQIFLQFLTKDDKEQCSKETSSSKAYQKHLLFNGYPTRLST